MEGESETQAERKSQFSPSLALGIELVLLILAVGVFGIVYTNGLQAAAIVVAVILAILVMWIFSGRKKSAGGSGK